MEENIRKRLSELQDYIENAQWDLTYAKEELDNLWDKLEDNSNK